MVQSLDVHIFIKFWVNWIKLFLFFYCCQYSYELLMFVGQQLLILVNRTKMYICWKWSGKRSWENLCKNRLIQLHSKGQSRNEGNNNMVYWFWNFWAPVKSNRDFNTVTLSLWFLFASYLTIWIEFLTPPDSEYVT